MNALLFDRRALPLALALLTLAGAPPTARAAGPPVQLVETVPIESGLGNPALPSAKDVWLEMIRGAKRSLDLEEFYLSTWPGEPMEPVLVAIGEAAKRGVRVRLLLDAGMHRTYPLPADSLGKLRDIEVRLIDMGRIAGGVQHAKYFMVDRAEVYLGSQNTDWRALEHIHELGVRVRDARVAAEFQRVFDMDWIAAGAGLDSMQLARHPMAVAPSGPPSFRIAQAPRDTVELWPSYSPGRFIPDSTRWDRDAIVRLLDSARGEIVVQLLTYSPTSRRQEERAIDDALRRAAERGVSVKLLISDWEKGTGGMASLQSLAKVGQVEVKLSTVPEWSGGYIPFARVEHCKYAVVDTQRVWVGTANWEPGYFLGTRNVAVTLANRPLATQARTIFQQSWTAPGAAPVVADSASYTPKVRGETPPPGRKKYGG